MSKIAHVPFLNIWVMIVNNGMLLIIDDSLYHCGHSLNANGGHKISAITLMGTSPDVILSKVE